MKRQIEFRGYQPELKKWVYGSLVKTLNGVAWIFSIDDKFLDKIEVKPESVGQYTEVKDRNGNKIYFGQSVIFADKWEWYRARYQIDIVMGTITKEDALKEIESKPFETRKVKSVKDYEWLLSSEVQEYWEVVNEE